MNHLLLKHNRFSFTMAKIIFSIFCLMITICTYAVPSIGTTQLLYKDSLALNSILNKIALERSREAPTKQFQINDKIMQVIAKQMPGYQKLLDTALVESGYFTVFDAEPELSVWKTKDPGFLRMVYKTTEVEPPIKPESKSFISPTSNSNPNAQPRKFILIGWIENITENKNKDVIYSTNKVSLIFSIDIRTEYRLINTRTNKVVAAFTAVGHGGMARILPNLNETVPYDIATMVNDMFYSLARNVRHGVRLKQQQFIREKIQLENAAKNSLVPKN